MYKKGFIFEYAGLEFQKYDDSDFGLWICLNSTYCLEVGKGEYEVRPESEKPFFKKDKNGKDTDIIDRYGFRWTDSQVKEYYNL